MANHTVTFTLLGSSGGVAKAILSILDKAKADIHDPIHSSIKDLHLHLIDHKQKDIDYYQGLFPNLQNNITLHEIDLRNTHLLQHHLISTKTRMVIDVSWADTVEMLQCCHDLGISYVNTALENTMVDETEDFEGVTLLERWRYFEENRGRFTNTTAIVCSGMNPGVVQWMALALLNQTPDETPLGCYIVEHDTSFYVDPSLIERKTIYTTWSTECFLDEAILNYPMFMKKGVPLIIYDDVYDLEFPVTLGTKKFAGCLMAHEEVISLGKMFDMETGFIYRVNDFTTDLIRMNINHPHDLWDWNHKILDPNDGELSGEDLVGVLLVYQDKERFMYNVKDNRLFAEYKTNATYFQVAAGLYGAIATVLLDNIPKGIYLVDELLTKTAANYGQYVSYYLKDFVTGENNQTEGLLLDRKRILSLKKGAVLF